MAWVRLDDRFLTNPKVLRAGRDARDFYLAGLFYSAGELTDGRVPREVLPHLAHVAGVATKKADDLAGILVGVGLWENEPPDFQIHDYLQYQPSADQVRAERANGSRRVADWRTRRAAYKKEGSNAGVTPLQARHKAVSNAPSNADVTPAPSPTPITSANAEDAPKANRKSKPTPTGPPKSAAVERFCQADEIPLHLMVEDRTALNAASQSAQEVYEAYRDAYRGRWGGKWLRENLSVRRVLGRWASYMAWKTGEPEPPPTNGHVPETAMTRFMRSKAADRAARRTTSALPT